MYTCLQLLIRFSPLYLSDCYPSFFLPFSYLLRLSLFLSFYFYVSLSFPLVFYLPLSLYLSLSSSVFLSKKYSNLNLNGGP